MTTERNILDKLNVVHPRMLTTNVLLNDVRLDDPKVTLGDLRLALGALEAKEQVISISGEETTRHKITPAGQARLLE